MLYLYHLFDSSKSRAKKVKNQPKFIFFVSYFSHICNPKFHEAIDCFYTSQLIK